MKSASMQAASLRAAGAPAMVPVPAKSARAAVVCKAMDENSRLAALESALRTGEVLKMQAKSEKERADASISQLRSVANQYSDEEFRQAEQIRAERIRAQEACMKAAVALEAERRAIEKLMSNTDAKGPDLVESERMARVRAEEVAMTLERKLSDVQARLNAASEGARPGSLVSTLANEANEMMEKASNLNNILKSQLTSEMARSAAAKELAVSRAKELEVKKSRAREQEKMLKMLVNESKQAEAAVKRTNEDLDAAEKERRAIMQTVAAAAKATEAAEGSKNKMYEARKKLATEEQRIKMVMVDSSRLQSLRDQLAQIEADNEQLKQQVAGEGLRASEANRSLAKYTNLIKEEDNLRKQLQMETNRKEAAYRAAQAAKVALAEERSNVDRIMREAGPALRELEDARANKTKANQIAAELEAQLRQANDRLEKQGRVLQSAETVLTASSSVSEEELAQAEAVIATMIKQVQMETQRKSEAQELARKQELELKAATEKVKDMEFRYKQMTDALEKARASMAATSEQLRNAPVNAASSSSSDQELANKLKQETERADALELQAAQLKDELDRALSERGSEISVPSDASEEEAEYLNIQHALSTVASQNDQLKSEVLSEGQRATKSARDLAQAHSRVSDMEAMLSSLRGEVSGMKSAMTDLRSQMAEAMGIKGGQVTVQGQPRVEKKEKKIEKATEELKESQRKWWCTVM